MQSPLIGPRAHEFPEDKKSQLLALGTGISTEGSQVFQIPPAHEEAGEGCPCCRVVDRGFIAAVLFRMLSAIEFETYPCLGFAWKLCLPLILRYE